MNKIEDVIETVAKQTAKQTVFELRKQGMMNDEKQTPFQKTESLLYNYNSFLAAIEDKQEQINEIEWQGLRKRSNSVIPSPGRGTKSIDERSNQDKIDERIAEIQASIATTKRFIGVINAALDKLRKSEIYYELIPMKYFQGKSNNEIAEYFQCDIRTIYRQKKRIVTKLQIRLFSDDTINQLYS